MIECAKSGCIDCHEIITRLLESFLEEGLDEEIEKIKDYALFRLINPLPAKKRGRPKRSILEIEYQVSVGAEVRELINSGMSLEAARFEVAERNRLSDSFVRDAYDALRIKIKK